MRRDYKAFIIIVLCVSAVVVGINLLNFLSLQDNIRQIFFLENNSKFIDMSNLENLIRTT